MRFVRGQGLSIADARQLRIEARDGELIVRQPGAPDRVIGPAGSFTSAVLLDYDQARRLVEPRTYLLLPMVGARRVAEWAVSRKLGTDSVELMRRSYGGTLVVSGRDGPALAVEVGDATPLGIEPSLQREESGATGLVRSLGLTLEPARDTDLPSRRAVRRALVKPERRVEPLVRASSVLTLAAGVLAFASLPNAETTAGVVCSVAALVAIAPLLVTIVRHRKLFSRLVEQPPDPQGRSVYRPPASVVGAANVQMQFGEHDVVLVNAGTERWIPGPAADGVVSCVVGGGRTAWFAADDVPQLVLRTSEIAPNDDCRQRLKEACLSAGIDAELRGTSGDYSVTPLSLRHQDNDDPGLWMSEWEKGRLSNTTEYLSPFGAGIHLFGALVIAFETGVWWLLAGSIAWIAVTVWAELRYRSWRRGVRRQANETGSDAN